jgi:hypothetical protein
VPPTVPLPTFFEKKPVPLKLGVPLFVAYFFTLPRNFVKAVNLTQEGCLLLSHKLLKLLTPTRRSGARGHLADEYPGKEA